MPGRATGTTEMGNVSQSTWGFRRRGGFTGDRGSNFRGGGESLFGNLKEGGRSVSQSQGKCQGDEKYLKKKGGKRSLRWKK